jgi:hypothetical protein
MVNWGIPGSSVEIYQEIFIPDMTGEWAHAMKEYESPQGLVYPIEAILTHSIN